MNKSSRQKGFTLIELLVVVGIIATLAAIAVPNVARFLAPAEATADDEEFGRVQAAMDMFIAETLSSPTVTENTTATNDFSATTPALYPLYMRDATTHCTYTWSTSGQMTQVTCP